MNLTWIFPAKPKLDFEIWEWPAAFYPGPAMRRAAMILGEDSYTPERGRSGNHKPLGLVLIRYNLPIDKSGEGRRMLIENMRFASMRDAIEYTTDFLRKNPDWQPLIH